MLKKKKNLKKLNAFAFLVINFFSCSKMCDIFLSSSFYLKLTKNFTFSSKVPFYHFNFLSHIMLASWRYTVLLNLATGPDFFFFKDFKKMVSLIRIKYSKLNIQRQILNAWQCHSMFHLNMYRVLTTCHSEAASQFPPTHLLW